MLTFMNYRRGVARLYSVLAICWIGWGLYRPRAAREGRVITSYDGWKYCEAELEKTEREAQALSLPQLYAIQAESCSKQYGQAIERANAIYKETLVDTYRVTGYGRVAAFCLVPPLASLAFLLVVVWIAQGFRNDRAGKAKIASTQQ